MRRLIVGSPFRRFRKSSHLVDVEPSITLEAPSPEGESQSVPSMQTAEDAGIGVPGAACSSMREIWNMAGARVSVKAKSQL